MAQFDLNDFLPYQLVVTADRISRALSRVYAEHDLTVPEWRIMAQLRHHIRATPGELVELTNMEKPRITRALVLLDKKSLIVRSQDENDRRIQHITLSKTGDKLFQRLEPEVLNWEQRFRDKLGPERHAELMSILREMDGWCRDNCEL